MDTIIEINKFKLGRYSCSLLKDFDFSYLTHDFFTNADHNELQQARTKYGILEDITELPYSVILLQDGQRNILVDTGIGYHDEPLDFGGQEVYLRGRLQQLLNKNGIAGEDINDVILTHLHPDHIGGIYSDDGTPNFPNALFHIHQTEWNFWNSDEYNNQHELFRLFFDKNIAPIDKNRISFIKNDFDEILPEVISINAPGHSIGHIALKVGNQQNQLLYLADSFIHPLHMENLDWRTNFDFDHDLAKRTRLKLLELAFSENLPMIATHFEFPSIGKIRKMENRWKWSIIPNYFAQNE